MFRLLAGRHAHIVQHGHGDLEHLHLVIGDFGVDADAAGPDDGEIERFVPRQVEVAGHGACGAALPGEVGVRVGAG